MADGCLSEQTVSDFVDRRLDVFATSAVESHIDVCTACRERISMRAPLDVALTVPSLPADDVVPTTIGRLEIFGRLGIGGMGVVYAAKDPALDRRVAVKVLHERARPHAARLLREAQALARLSHPNVVAVYDVGEWEGRVFVAMEAIDGTTLRGWLAAKRRSWREIRDIFVQAGQGLVAAHAAGFVHRDFKPDNVLVGNDGRVAVSDFGLARVGDEALAAPPPSALTTDLTLTNEFLGTPAYMAPEQLVGHAVDARADQFAFSVALFEALTGRRPYQGATVAELYAAIEAGAPRAAHGPSWLRRAVVRGLAADPAARFPSLTALLTAIDRDPSRTLRRVAIAVGAVAVVAVAASLIGVRAAAPDPLCTGADAQLAGIWDPLRKQSLRDALHATGRAHADTSWLAIERMVDTFARDWVAMHDDTCAATAIRHEQSSDVLDLRMHCLAARRTELVTLTDLIAHADAALADRAVRLAEGLSPLARCADVAALRTLAPLPADPKTRDEIAALERVFAEVRVLRDANRMERANALLADAFERSRITAYAPVVAEAQYLLGVLAARRGDFPTAHKYMVEATLTAEAGRADLVKVWAQTGLIQINLRESKLPEASEAARQAQATLTRLGGSHPLERARIENNLANLLTTEEHYEEGLGHYRAALDVYRTELGETHGEVATTIGNIGGTYVELDRPAEGIPYLKKALALHQQLLGNDHPTVAVDMANLASALARTDHAAEAQAMLERALAISVATQADPISIGMMEAELAHLVRDDPAAAVPHLLRALAALGSDPSVPSTHNELGEAYFHPKKYDDALAQYEAAAQELAPRGDHRELANAYEGISDVMAVRKDHVRALALLEKALAIRQRVLPADHWMTTRTLVRLAELSWTTGDRQRARDFARQAGATAWLASHR